MTEVTKPANWQWKESYTEIVSFPKFIQIFQILPYLLKELCDAGYSREEVESILHSEIATTILMGLLSEDSYTIPSGVGPLPEPEERE